MLLLVIGLVGLGLPGCAVAYHSTDGPSARAAIDQSTASNEDSIIDPVNFYSQRTKAVIALFDNVQKLPSCNKNAAKALVHDCQAIDTSATLENVKAIYAARLAVCELSEAHVDVPSACVNFIPTKHKPRRREWRGYFRRNGPSTPEQHDIDYEQSTEADLDACLKDLHSRSQSWTSFSNNRQNAVMMCQAARAEVEQDEQINLFKSYTEMTYGTVNDLAESRQQYQQVKEEFHQITVRMRDFHQALFADQEAVRLTVQRSWNEAAERWRGHLEDFGGKVQAMNEKLSEATEKIEDNSREINKAHHKASQHIADFAIKQQTHADQLHADLSSMHEALGYINEHQIQRLQQHLFQTGKSVEEMNGVALSNYGQMQDHTLAIAKANQELLALQQKAAGLDSIMTYMHEKNVQRHLKIQDHANRTIARLEVAQSAATNLAVALGNLSSFIGDGIMLVFDLLMGPGVFVAHALIFASAWRALLGKLPVASWTSVTIVTSVVFASVCSTTGGPVDLVLYLYRSVQTPAKANMLDASITEAAFGAPSLLVPLLAVAATVLALAILTATRVHTRRTSRSRYASITADVDKKLPRVSQSEFSIGTLPSLGVLGDARAIRINDPKLFGPPQGRQGVGRRLFDEGA